MDHKGLTDVEFIQVIDGQSFVIRCRYCNATGRRPRFMNPDDLEVTEFSDIRCDVCNGKGMLRLKSPDIPVNCGPCQGTGRMKSFLSSTMWSSITCSYCRGFGILALTGSVERIRG
jgi:hypothetical protein